MPSQFQVEGSCSTRLDKRILGDNCPESSRVTKRHKLEDAVGRLPAMIESEGEYFDDVCVMIPSPPLDFVQIGA